MLMLRISTIRQIYINNHFTSNFILCKMNKNNNNLYLFILHYIRFFKN